MSEGVEEPHGGEGVEKSNTSEPSLTHSLTHSLTQQQQQQQQHNKKRRREQEGGTAAQQAKKKKRQVSDILRPNMTL